MMETATHTPECHFVILQVVWDGMIGNQKRDCDCGGYAKAVSGVEKTTVMQLSKHEE